VNEKFEPNTETDEYLMCKQHRIIAAKIQSICQCLGKKSDEDLDEEGEEEEEGKISVVLVVLFI